MRLSRIVYVPKFLLYVYLITGVVVIYYSTSKPFSLLFPLCTRETPLLVDKVIADNAHRLHEANKYILGLKKLGLSSKLPSVELVVSIITINRENTSNGIPARKKQHLSTSNIPGDRQDNSDETENAAHTFINPRGKVKHGWFSSGTDNRQGYLVQTVASMHTLLKSSYDNFRSSAMFVCNVDIRPEMHTDAMFVSEYIPNVKMSDWLPGRPNSTMSRDRYRKETTDYIFCLQQAQLYNPKYILVLEDDAVPNADMLAVLKLKLQHLSSGTDSLGYTIPRPFGFIKMYYPERWQGYAIDIRTCVELLAIGLLGGCITSLLAMKISLAKITRRHLSFFKTPCVSSFMFGALYFVLLALIVGRQNVNNLRRLSMYLYSLQSAPGCCTPAILYSDHVIQPLIEFLSGVQTMAEYHFDIALDDFAVESKLKSYLIEPNLFRHIGMMSSFQDRRYNRYNFKLAKLSEFL